MAPHATVATGSRSASILPALGLSFILAASVCLAPYATPVVSAGLGLDLLRSYPYLLGLAVAGAALAALIAAMIARGALRARGAIFIVAALLAAQLMGFKLGPVDPLEVVTLAYFLVWMIVDLGDRHYPIVVSPLLPGMLGMIFCAWLSLMNVHAWIPMFVLALVALVIKFGGFFLLTQTVRTPAAVRLGANVLAGVALFSAIAGVIQVGLFYFTGIVLTTADQDEPMTKPTPFGVILRATALSDKPQHLAGFLVLALPVLLFKVSWPGAPARLRLRWALGLLVLCTALILTLAVGAWITLGLVLLLFPYVRWPARAIHVTAALACILLLVHFSGIGEWAYASLSASGILKGGGQRVYLLSLALEKLERNAFIGEGMRMFPRFTMNYRQFPVHNAYFQAAADLGVFGGLFFLLIVGALLARLAALARFTGPLEDKLTLKMFLLGMLAFVSNSLAEPTYDHSNTWIYFGLTEAAILTFTAHWVRRGVPRSPLGAEADLAR